MRYEITKEFSFDSAHQLPGREIYGKCDNVHGHTYTLFVTVGSNILTDGMVINFVRLKEIVNPLIEMLDHTFLNDVDLLREEVTTCENMSREIFDYLNDKLAQESPHVFMVEVKLYETPTSACSYRG